MTKKKIWRFFFPEKNRWKPPENSPNGKKQHWQLPSELSFRLIAVDLQSPTSSQVDDVMGVGETRRN